jgi:hypothetical protein
VNGERVALFFGVAAEVAVHAATCVPRCCLRALVLNSGGSICVAITNTLNLQVLNTVNNDTIV